MRGAWRDGDRTRTVEITPEGASWRVVVDGNAMTLAAEPLEGGRFRLTGPNGVTIAEVTSAGNRRFVRLGAMDFVLDREAGGRRRASSAAGGSLEAPMPGVVTRVHVSAGDQVEKGQPLIAIEAMKMEHVVRAPRAGRVKRVAATAGAMVQGGVALVELEPQES
jgi:biotin carboxyl carrier protein